jgi:hypothetical protein
MLAGGATAGPQEQAAISTNAIAATGKAKLRREHTPVIIELNSLLRMGQSPRIPFGIPRLVILRVSVDN